ncbi:bifunctional metallophosphatase/5'-nucleotidase [Myxococcota bacterium]|nr:bifunctional metallophosphatase/5'-nucleotidase [Myxococcota bacterium]
MTRPSQSAALLTLGLAACVVPRPPEPNVTPERALRLLAFNDVYRAEGFPESDVGGFARLRTLRLSLEAESPDLMLLGAGDFWYPSLLSRTYDGAQVVEALNALDGDEPAYDPMLLTTLGNHELDKTGCSGAKVVQDRLTQSQFDWVISNLTLQGCDSTPTPTSPRLLPWTIREVGGVKVGVFGLLLPLDGPRPYVAELRDPVETARATVALLRAEGAEVIVGLTHQAMADDVALLRTLGADGPDLIVGGHEHNAQRDEVDGRLVVKADADLRTAAVWTVRVGADGAVTAEAELRALDASVAEDPVVAKLVNDRLAEHDASFCAGISLPPGCLAEPLGRHQGPLIGEELSVRRFETSLGDWAADVMLAAVPGADVALVNSGGLRMNEDLPAGASFTRQHLETLLPWAAPLTVLELDAATLEAALDHGVTDWTGNGHWLQVAGLGFTHDVAATDARALRLITPKGDAPLPTDRPLRVVTLDYMAQGNDGFVMLKDAPRAKDQPNADLKVLLQLNLAAAPDGVPPPKAGRICNTQTQTGCP